MDTPHTVTLYDAQGIALTYNFQTNGWKCDDPSTLLWVKNLLPPPFANAVDLRAACAVYGLASTRPDEDTRDAPPHVPSDDTLDAE